MNTEQFSVEPFGQDCLGNITGYRVARGAGLNKEIADQFVADLYEAGSHEAMKKEAEYRCARLNEPAPHVSEPLYFDDDGFGSPQSVIVVQAESFIGLREAIRAQRWRSDIYSDHDCTGIEFSRSAKLLHVAETDGGYSAVLLITRSFDV